MISRKLTNFLEMNYHCKPTRWTLLWVIFLCAMCQVFIQAENEFDKLPLIVLKTRDSEYKFPKCLSKNMFNQLKYYSPNENTKVVHFCPKSIGSYVLHPTKSEKCKIEPTPKIRRASDEESQLTECPNQHGSYLLYTYGYQVDFKISEHIWNDWVNVYSFCFNLIQNRILYISYQIISPSLQTSHSLQEELSYLDKEYKTNSFNDPVLENYIDGIMKRHNEYDNYFANTQQAMIATPFDMPFAILKKAFTHMFNYAFFSHFLKAQQWTKISVFIRKLAIQGWGELHVKTGAIYPDTERGNKHSIWWKLVITQDETSAIAIILHDIALMDQTPYTEFKCSTSCTLLGFDEMIESATETFLFCCHPNVISRHIEGLKPYELLDLRSESLKPPSVDCGSTS